MTKKIMQLRKTANGAGKTRLHMFIGCKVRITANNKSRWRVVPASGVITISENASAKQTIEIDIDVVRTVFPVVDLRRLCGSLRGENRIIEVEE